MSVHELPLFPLERVLFPGTSLSLHIFEPRYRNMIGRCIDQNAPFGVLLIKEGSEGGEPAIPHAVGTTARIVHVTRHPDGRMNIRARGEHRFRLVSLIQEQPHLVGRIEEIAEDDDHHLWLVDPALVAEVREEYGACICALVMLQGGWVRGVEALVDPVELSYSVPDEAEFELITQQEMLEIPSAVVRLERELAILRRARLRMERELKQQSSFTGPRLN